MRLFCLVLLALALPTSAEETWFTPREPWVRLILEPLRETMFLSRQPIPPQPAKVVAFLREQAPEVHFPENLVCRYLLRGDGESFAALVSLASGEQRDPSTTVAVAGHAEDVAAILQLHIPDASVDLESANQIRILGTPDTLARVRTVLASDEVMLDVKLVDLTKAGEKTLGVTWRNEPGTEQTLELVNGVETKRESNELKVPVGSYATSP